MRAHPKDAVAHLLFENIVPVSTAWYGKAIFTPVKAADEQKTTSQNTCFFSVNYTTFQFFFPSYHSRDFLGFAL